MTGDRLVIISADCHAGPQSMEDFRPYLDPEYRADYDDYLARLNAYEANYHDGFVGGGANSAPAPGEEGLWDVDVRERCLDGDRVSAEVIFTQGGLPFGVWPAVGGRDRMLDYDASPGQIAAGCRAYNRWLAAFCSKNPERHLGIARVALPDVDSSIEEVEFAAKAGLRGGVMLPALSKPGIPNFNDPVYEPFWAACAAHDMPLNMHGGAQLTYGPGHEAMALGLVEVDWFSRRGMAHLIFTGVFERYPNLHLALTEQRTHWLAPTLHEFDSIYGSWLNGRGRANLPRLPSDYFRTNCFVGASFLSRLECEDRGEIGSHCFMWGSDYPHGEGTWPETDVALRHALGCGVSSGELKAMLGENAARCYNLDLAALQPIADRIGPTEEDLRLPVTALPRQEPGDPAERSWAFRKFGPWN